MEGYPKSSTAWFAIENGNNCIHTVLYRAVPLIGNKSLNTETPIHIRFKIKISFFTVIISPPNGYNYKIQIFDDICEIISIRHQRLNVKLCY